MEITTQLASRVLEVVDAGLSSGLGEPTPGMMCVEAAVCYAMGLPHGDEPTCVSPALRQLKIDLNDKEWSSNASRAKGLRRLAVAQLGTAGTLDDKKFLMLVAEMTIRKIVPRALRSAAGMLGGTEHAASLEVAARNCEAVGTPAAAYAVYAAADAAYAAYAAYAADSDAYAAARAAARAVAYAAADAAYAADAAARAAAYAAAAYAATYDEELSFFAEEVVQILIHLETPGSKFLALTE